MSATENEPVAPLREGRRKGVETGLCAQQDKEGPRRMGKQRSDRPQALMDETEQIWNLAFCGRQTRGAIHEEVDVERAF